MRSPVFYTNHRDCTCCCRALSGWAVHMHRRQFPQVKCCRPGQFDPPPPTAYALPAAPTVVYWNQEFVFAGLQDGKFVVYFYDQNFDELVPGPFPLRRQWIFEFACQWLAVLSASYHSQSHTLAFSTASIISAFEFNPRTGSCSLVHGVMQTALTIVLS